LILNAQIWPRNFNSHMGGTADGIYYHQPPFRPQPPFGQYAVSQLPLARRISNFAHSIYRLCRSNICLFYAINWSLESAEKMRWSHASRTEPMMGLVWIRVSMKKIMLAFSTAGIVQLKSVC